jgi:hypothetical protein
MVVWKCDVFNWNLKLENVQGRWHSDISSFYCNARSVIRDWEIRGSCCEFDLSLPKLGSLNQFESSSETGGGGGGALEALGVASRRRSWGMARVITACEVKDAKGQRGEWHFALYESERRTDAITEQGTGKTKAHTLQISQEQSLQ